MEPEIVYTWERRPEYRATLQFSRSLGRVLASLPRRVRWKCERPLVRGATMIGIGIAGANADPCPGELISCEEREAFRDAALEAVRLCREGLETLRETGFGSRPDLLVTLELLERIESGLKT
ncbi:MAG: hypothetical protein HY561_05550 [Gemmatimonadetes bacterium]|nr:hypothetical protein [Gemmatimonadota bacterium]